MFEQKSLNNQRLLSGLPHSEISGSKPILGSPKLIAEYHVLHRLLLPRHPPNALLALDLIQRKIVPTNPASRTRMDHPSQRQFVDRNCLSEVLTQVQHRMWTETAPWSECFLDLERLLLLALPPSAPERMAQNLKRHHAPAPHLAQTQKRLVYCSLNDVNVIRLDGKGIKIPQRSNRRFVPDRARTPKASGTECNQQSGGSRRT